MSEKEKTIRKMKLFVIILFFVALLGGCDAQQQRYRITTCDGTVHNVTARLCDISEQGAVRCWKDSSLLATDFAYGCVLQFEKLPGE